jgi:hypothetical protein
VGDNERVNLDTAKTLDSVYLGEALEALLEAGDPAVLYANTAEPGGDTAKEAYVTAIAHTRRIKSCPRCVLYAAFAAEAFINSFIAATLNRHDRKLIDRNSTIQKFILGPRLAVKDDLAELEERSEIATITRLFTLRNALVHPRSRELEEIRRTGSAKWRSDEYNPGKAAEFVVAVADEAYTLSQLHEDVPMSATAHLVVLGKEKILEFGQQAEAVPERTATPSLTMADLQTLQPERFGLNADG